MYSQTFSLRTADAFPVVASLPPKNSYFSEGEKQRPEMRLRFAGYQTLSCSLTKVPEIPLITVKLTCIMRSPFGNGSLTAQYRLTVFLIQVWQTWDLFKKMKVKSEISIQRQIDLHLFLVPLRGPKEKKVKDRLTPYTVRPVALVWYVFPKWTFNGGEDNKK